MPRPKRRTQTRELHRRTIARTQPPCGICGEPIDYTLRWPDPDAFVADHVTPLALGGSDTLDNKQAAHNRCNSDKRAKPHADIIKRSGSLARPNTGPQPAR